MPHRTQSYLSALFLSHLTVRNSIDPFFFYYTLINGLIFVFLAAKMSAGKMLRTKKQCLELVHSSCSSLWDLTNQSRLSGKKRKDLKASVSNRENRCCRNRQHELRKMSFMNFKACHHFTVGPWKKTNLKMSIL